MLRFYRRTLCQAAGLSLCLGAPLSGPGAAPVSTQPAPPAPPADPSAITILTPGRSAVAPPTHEELLKMAPEEREARLKSLRDRKVQTLKALTPAEREQRRLEIRQRLEKRLESLKKRKKERPLNAEEEKQLRRLEEVYRGFQTPKKPKTDPAVLATPDKK